MQQGVCVGGVCCFAIRGCCGGGGGGMGMGRRGATTFPAKPALLCNGPWAARAPLTRPLSLPSSLPSSNRLVNVKFSKLDICCCCSGNGKVGWGLVGSSEWGDGGLSTSLSGWPVSFFELRFFTIILETTTCAKVHTVVSPIYFKTLKVAKNSTRHR